MRLCWRNYFSTLSWKTLKTKAYSLSPRNHQFPHDLLVDDNRKKNKMNRTTERKTELLPSWKLWYKSSDNRQIVAVKGGFYIVHLSDDNNDSKVSFVFLIQKLRLCMTLSRTIASRLLLTRFVNCFLFLFHSSNYFFHLTYFILYMFHSLNISHTEAPHWRGLKWANRF